MIVSGPMAPTLRSVVLRRALHDWGSAYRITDDGRVFEVTRRDDGSQTHVISPWALLNTIAEDYRARPVPRDGLTLTD